MSNILPRTQNITGTSLTGSDGSANRTYTLPEAGTLSSGMAITINGTSLLPGATSDYTLVGDTVTFLNIVDDTDLILINYFVVSVTPSEASLSTSTSLKYATPIMLAEALGCKVNIPSWAAGTSPSNEEVGTGNNSVTTFWLDQRSVLSDTYTLYYGSTATTTDELTETTHYTIDKDDGKITLTTAGKTLVDTNNIYAEYSYINNGMSNSYLITVLSRAEKEVDNSVNSTFTDSTTNNPVYPIKTEIRNSLGYFMNQIIVEEKPLKDVSTTLDGALTDSATSIDLLAGTGTTYPTSGTLIIGSEVITYTGITTDQLTGVTRGALSSTAATHNDGDDVHSTIFFTSDTSQGSAVVWTAHAWGTGMYASSGGLMFKYGNSWSDNYTSTLSQSGVANRTKIIYLYGYDTVPSDITRLTIIYAKRMLTQDNISKAMVAGRNEFVPEMFNADMNEIDRIVNSYIVLPMGNT